MTRVVKVAVLGGGVAGLSTAHQLVRANAAQAEVHFDITVLDAGPRFGGKCRTFDQSGFAGEHGFRFFPGFYKNVTTTMGEIPVGDGDETVADRLVPLREAAFYAKRDDDGTPAEMTVELTKPSPVIVALGSTLARLLIVISAGLGAWIVGWSWWLLALAAVAIAWWNVRLLAAMGWMMRLRSRIPKRVRPHLFESFWMFLQVAQLATATPERMTTQYDEQSWWSFIQAWRRTDAYQLALATGLTRTFVATRAETMSARTGGGILAQLLYDINPYFTTKVLNGEKIPADRVLDRPTSDAWIQPWVEHLTASGVRFNTLPDSQTPPDWTVERGPLIQRLLEAPSPEPTEWRRVTGFGWGFQGAGWSAGYRTGLTNEVIDWAEVATVDEEFDEYVLAISGASAQQVLANSQRILQADTDLTVNRRRHELAPHGVPPLHGIFDLEFGWMSGIVFHLTDLDGPLDLPRGHLLLLESEWALTVLDQQPHWKVGVHPSNEAIISVNISDWFSPSRSGLPAQYEDFDEIAAEVWGQMQEHIPALADLARPEYPHVVFDYAIVDPETVFDTMAMIRGDAFYPDGSGIQNLSLQNGEQLLINTARSWQKRPAAVTAFDNLFLAGDYVRTYSDFASMEAADESARWAAHAIAAKHGVALSRPTALEVPAEIRTMVGALRAVDRVAFTLGLPHPLGLVAVPFSLVAGLESFVRGPRSR